MLFPLPISLHMLICFLLVATPLTLILFFAHDSLAFTLERRHVFLSAPIRSILTVILSQKILVFYNLGSDDLIFLFLFLSAGYTKSKMNFITFAEANFLIHSHKIAVDMQV